MLLWWHSHLRWEMSEASSAHYLTILKIWLSEFMQGKLIANRFQGRDFTQAFAKKIISARSAAFRNLNLVSLSFVLD
ncbi:hypothetical protein N473_05085 [Pseudoalteromonas luteoviolacea CPMOR-1]|uniref:Uncharacterized protein n=1 Tax=Pseudoalteromonas luteoviolacea CPMOR-1 TaxID=1365248 RepID=A0A167HGT9_9GAMM|nr:hypothetical protein N473_05085 [Pseudoalteromonas luteoviolacea CPMOR-1]